MQLVPNVFLVNRLIPEVQRQGVAKNISKFTILQRGEALRITKASKENVLGQITREQ